MERLLSGKDPASAPATAPDLCCRQWYLSLPVVARVSGNGGPRGLPKSHQARKNLWFCLLAVMQVVSTLPWQTWGDETRTELAAEERPQFHLTFLDSMYLLLPNFRFNPGSVCLASASAALASSPNISSSSSAQ